MRFTKTKFDGLILIEMEPHQDERGFFARSFCEKEFADQGIKDRFVQHNVSFNQKEGTLRGMHYQTGPYPESKVVRCVSGAIFDVVIDLRQESSTYKNWFSVELSADNKRMLYIPKGFAHGFQTLKANTEVFYLMGEFYHPESARGIRWDDPVFDIDWPLPKKVVISERDRSYPDFQE